MSYSTNSGELRNKNLKLERVFNFFDKRVLATVVDSTVGHPSVNRAEVNPTFVPLPEPDASKYKAKFDFVNEKQQAFQVTSANRWGKFLASYYSLFKKISLTAEADKPKRNLLIRLKEMFDNNTAEVSIIYLCGPGNNKGHFLMESKQAGVEELAFKEVLGEWDKRTSHQRFLFVVADFNFSGKWGEELKKEPKRMDSVAVLCATHANQKGSFMEMGTYFTHNLLKLFNKISSESILQVPSTPWFSGDLLLTKKYTNLYCRFPSWADIVNLQKAEFAIIDYDNGQFCGHVVNGQKKYWGTFVWKSGSFKDCVYSGEFDKGKPEGLGIMKYNNGRVYEGQFKASAPEGKGIEYYANGDRYVGEFAKGFKAGQGTYHYSNGDIYKGTFSGNKPNGKGKLTMAKGAVYEGNFVNGKCQGTGEYRYENGDIYSGDWSNSVKHGEGTYKYANGDVYKGGFLNGLRQGKGKLSLPSGETYEGHWENDMMHGDGKYSSLERTIVGEWVKGKQVSGTDFYKKEGTQRLPVNI
jgi:hypothetical protein